MLQLSMCRPVSLATFHRREQSEMDWRDEKKQCAHCGTEFVQHATEAISTFSKRKFCSKPCADVAGFRFSGSAHYRWRGGRTKRSGLQSAWARKVISRDSATCQKCGATGVELHAHHIKDHKSHPELRWKLDNGITVCAPCHWKIHSASNENAVNSGNPQHNQGGGNPEPSQSLKALEGVTTRGRAYRRIETTCAECGKFISRRFSDAAGKSNLFCSYSCSSRHRVRVSGKCGNRYVHGGNASTSAAPERDDIV